MHFKLATVTRLDIIFFDGQVIHIPYREYTRHSLNPPVIIPEGELVCLAQFLTPMIKTSHWYHETRKAIPVMMAAAAEIEYNTMGEFQNSDCNTHGYYIVKWTGNAYTLQEIYKCHAFDPTICKPYC